MRMCVCACTDPGQLLLQGLLGGLRAAVQLGALLTHNLSQPLYSAPFCLQQLTRLAYTQTYTHARTNTHVHICLCVQTNTETHKHAYTHTRTHTGQREDGSVSGVGEPQLVTTATRSEGLASKEGGAGANQKKNENIGLKGWVTGEELRRN